jgi:hypothetical protein
MSLYIVYETNTHVPLKIWGTAYHSFEKALAAVAKEIDDVNAVPCTKDEEAPPGQMDAYDIATVAEGIMVADIGEGRIQFFIKALSI